MRRVGITGVGAVTPFGLGISSLEEGLRQGRSGLAAAQALATDDFRSSMVGEIDRDVLAQAPYDQDIERCLALAFLAGKEALDQGNALHLESEGICLALGTGGGEARAAEQYVILESKGLIGQRAKPPRLPTLVTASLASALDIGERCLTFVSACTAGCTAIATCYDLIRLGEADVALAGGVDILSRGCMAGFNSLHALAPNRCRPFDVNREGTQLGEAAAFVLLESLDHAAARGQPVLAEFAGYGMSSDAFHPTRSDPEGRGPQAAMVGALKDACLSADAIDYINAHGTATFQNDLIELNAIRAVFGERRCTVPISSTKSQVGHSAGACGAVECVVCVLALCGQILPPTLNIETPLQGFEGYDFVNQPGRSVRLRHVMSNSFAFGGFNLSLILSSAES